jgi:ABC-2 type transport system permease protein
MLRGLFKLTWIEIKIFLREPLGAFGTIGIPVLVFLGAGRVVGRRLPPAALSASSFIGVGLPVLASVLIAVSAVVSLVTIISIYREGGILKRLRATPLRPQTILTAHVIVKLLLTAATGLDGAGRQTLLPGWHSSSIAGVHDRARDQYV